MMDLNNNYYVYTHTSPSGKVYVGITSDIKRRWGCKGEHYTWKRKNGEYMHKPFAHAIFKYGWDNFEHTIILSNRPKSEAIYAEKYLIRWYKMHNLSYNITDGGEGVLGTSHPVSEEVRKKMSEFMKAHHPMMGKHHSVESRKKMSEAKKGIGLSTEHALHISESLKGREISEEHKNKLRQFMKVHPERWAPGNSRNTVYQYSLEGNYITSYSSAYEAAISVSGKNNAGCIRSNIYGETSSALGYLWSYDKRERIKIPLKSRNKRTNCKKRINQYSLEGVYINTYDSIAEASKCTGIVGRSISKCCDPDIRIKRAGNYIWEYDTITNRANKKIEIERQKQKDDARLKEKQINKAAAKKS